MTKQYTSVLSRNQWNAVVIRENNEPLVTIQEDAKIKITPYAKRNNEGSFVRKQIYEMLRQASVLLPDGYVLLVTEGYRSVESQKQSWEKMFEKIKKEHPLLSDEAIEKKVRMVVAKPSLLANHNCGGAIDVTLGDTNGNHVDMGTEHLSQETTPDAMKKFPMFPNTFWKRLITKEQEQHRKILRDAMVSAGFVWYPGEWWHYCYGDRMWAMYTGRKECFYGPIEK